MKGKREQLFPLFSSHLDFAHSTWEKLLRKGDWVIDATCGNGHDTLFLSQLVGESGGVIGMDLQETAIGQTKKLLEGTGLENIHLFCQSHTHFPPLTAQYPIRLVVYNLGYLPGADKRVTTLEESTLKSIQLALETILHGGMISITCYPGHAEGVKEEIALQKLLKNLASDTWSVTHKRWINRTAAPSLILIQKNI